MNFWSHRQVMGLLEVVTSNAGTKADSKTKAKTTDVRALPSSTDATGGPDDSQTGEAASSPTEATGGTDTSGRNQTVGNVPATEDTEAPRPEASADPGALSGEGVEPSTSGSDHKHDAAAVLLSLPEPELRNLCKLLAREG